MLGDSLRRRNPPSAPPARKAPPTRRGRFPAIRWWHWLLAVILIPLVAFGTGYLISTQILFPTPETAGAGVPVPDLYGEDRQGAEGTLAEAGLGVGAVAAQASMKVPAGQVVAQSPVPGQQLRPGATVDLTMSSGPPELRVAPVEGLAAELARELLEEAGFAVEVTQVPSQVPAGAVARTDPAPGTPLRLPATITLFVSLGPPTIEDPVGPSPTPGGEG